MDIGQMLEALLPKTVDAATREGFIGLSMVVLAFGIRAGIAWLQARSLRSKSLVVRARAALARAKLTKAEEDDAIADMALESARNDQEFYGWWLRMLTPLAPPPATKE